MSRKVVFLLVLFLIPSVYSWGWSTHEFICNQIYQTNKELNRLLERDVFLQGCLAPDKEFKDTRYHHCYVAKECKEIDISKKESASLTYFADLRNCVGSEYFDCPALEKFEESVATGKAENFSFYLGAAVHYLSDAYVPLHQVMGENYWKCHLPFEREVDTLLEKGDRSWVVSKKCEVYFPCRKAGSVARKCDKGYEVDITFSYADVVEIVRKTDDIVSEELGIAGGDYSHLVGKKYTGFFGLILRFFEKLFGWI